MFFRRPKPHVDTFQERIESLKKYGIAAQGEAGRVRASRNNIAAMVTDSAGSLPHVDRAGLIVGNEIGELVNAGYQQFWLTPSKKRVPATAQQLKDLHEFEEDLKEGLGLLSLYNTSLGTTSALHLYDRVADRDEPVAERKPWETRITR